MEMAVNAMDLKCCEKYATERRLSPLAMKKHFQLILSRSSFLLIQILTYSGS